MKLFAIAALAALTVAAQNAKTEAKPTERVLTETESLKLRLAAAQLELLQKKYDIEKYQKEAQPIQAEQESLAMAVCRSIGIPDDKIRTECAINTGAPGADGKATPARVWWNRPK